MKTAIVILLALTISLPVAWGIGAKTHGDACNLLVSGLQFLDNENNYAEACDKDKGLYCAINKCSCLPTHAWRQNAVEFVFGVGGYCANAMGAAGAITATVPIIIMALFALVLVGLAY